VGVREAHTFLKSGSHFWTRAFIHSPESACTVSSRPVRVPPRSRSCRSRSNDRVVQPSGGFSFSAGTAGSRTPALLLPSPPSSCPPLPRPRPCGTPACGMWNTTLCHAGCVHGRADQGPMETTPSSESDSVHREEESSVIRLLLSVHIALVSLLVQQCMH
jgi:hypothetical protein